MTPEKGAPVFFLNLKGAPLSPPKKKTSRAPEVYSEYDVGFGDTILDLVVC